MSDLVGNPEDRFSRVAAHCLESMRGKIWGGGLVVSSSSQGMRGQGFKSHFVLETYTAQKAFELSQENQVSEQVRHKPSCTSPGDG